MGMKSKLFGTSMLSQRVAIPDGATVSSRLGSSMMRSSYLDDVKIKASATKIEKSFNAEVFMGNELKLLEHWRELTPQKQQKVLEFVELLKSEPETTPTESDFVPQTPLAKKLWSIRQRAIASGLQLLSQDEIELELTARRGGFRES